MTTANIQDSGLRGYLKWLQLDQPGLYQRVAPVIARQVPQAFSDFEQSKAMGDLWGLGQDESTDDATSELIASSDSDIAAAANTGGTDPGTVSAVGSIVNSALQSAIAADASAGAQQAIASFAQANNTQLQNAQAGIPPAQISSQALGVPQLFSTVGAAFGGSSTTGGVIVVVGVLALVGLGLAASSK